MYLDKEGNVIKGASTLGHLAVGLPGSVSGLELALEKYGTMTRVALIAPAIKHAQEGFVLDQGDVDLLLSATGDFRKDTATGATEGELEPHRHGDRYSAIAKCALRHLELGFRRLADLAARAHG